MNAPLSPEVRAHLERAIAEVTLDDKYTLERGRAFMSGTQALVRLMMLQRERDRRAGLNTAGFVSGYRGSPLGALDQALWKAKGPLSKSQIVFQPGLNEDLAATSVWGTQQVGMNGKRKVDGVFSMWYGKGPGVDRSGDVFKHANAAGTSKHGGVLVIAGDDHGAKSSTLPHQSEHIFKACGIPVLFPTTVQEYLDMGVHGWAMSRYSGLWVSMKAVTDVVESSASVDVDPERVNIILPDDFVMPDDPHGLNIRWPDAPLAQEARLFNYKWYAALAYVRANRLNHTVIDSSHAWFGIITAGKAYLDTMQALDALGLDREACEQLGIRVFKCGCTWPLEAATMHEFASGLNEILVVEEKRQIIEYQLKEELYNWPDERRPKVYGKFDEKDGRGGEWAMPQGQWLLPGLGELSPATIARAIAARLLNPGQNAPRFGGSLPQDIRRRIEERIEILDARDRLLAEPHVTVNRQPTFCSGCPHNTSTHVPEGSRALAGIGCHYMTVWMPERRTETFTQMGGEGTTWIGQSPFVDEQHVFANLGDGTYFHSGLLAVRASIAAGVNITYKILFNDAVAMTGGQPVDGQLTVPMIVTQMRGEGAKKIVIVTDEPEKYDEHRDSADLKGIEVYHRDSLDRIQRELREVKGTSVLIYDQTCASEKRRRRKRIVDGKPGFPDPARRVVINELVCEGCGDCSEQSSCISVEPVETDFGRKRRINQSSCNKDYSCLKGFCPSFVTVEGGQLRKGKQTPKEVRAELAEQAAPAPADEDSREQETMKAAGPAKDVKPSRVAEGLAEPQIMPIGETGDSIHGILVTGIGGTGVVTIGQLLGMAAHLEGRGVSVLDMAGLAQKGGAVSSHVQIAASPDRLHATRIATGEADLVLGCDLVVTAGNDILAKMRPRVTRGVINADVSPTSDFMRNPDWALPDQALRQNIIDAAGAEDLDFIPASELSVALLGDAIYTNPMVLGYACQKGWLPLSRAALERAIELNGTQVRRNLEAFDWGRRAAVDIDEVRRTAGLDDASRAARARSGAADASGPEGAGASVITLHRPANVVRTAADLDALIERRAEFLVGYQNRRLAKKYRALVDRVRRREIEVLGEGAAQGRLALSEAVARYWFKVLAYKDEYEVARLQTNPAFRESIAKQFEGAYTLKFHLAPPLWANRNDPDIGRPRKKAYGEGMLKAMDVLKHFKFLRGTMFDPFGRMPERQAERRLIEDYAADIDLIVHKLGKDRLRTAIELASLPEKIRGFGPVKDRHLERAYHLRRELRARLSGVPSSGTQQEGESGSDEDRDRIQAMEVVRERSADEWAGERSADAAVQGVREGGADGRAA